MTSGKIFGTGTNPCSVIIDVVRMVKVCCMYVHVCVCVCGCVCECADIYI